MYINKNKNDYSHGCNDNESSPSTAFLSSSQIETPNIKVAAHCPLVGTKNNHSKKKSLDYHGSMISLLTFLKSNINVD